MQRGSGPIYLLVVGIIILLVILYGIKISGGLNGLNLNGVIRDFPIPNKACTLEARICPDGTAVGRSGANCEFTACPSGTASSSADILAWKNYTNSYYSLKYPANYNIVTEDNHAAGDFIISPVPYPQGTLEQNNLQKVGYIMGVMVFPAQGQTLEGLAKKYDQFKNRAGYSRNPYIYYGLSGYQLTDIGADFPTYAVSLLKNDREYFIFVKYYAKNDSNSEAKLIYEQILKSFQFN